jgi:hypothetical protein
MSSTIGAPNQDFSTGNDLKIMLIVDTIGEVQPRHITSFHATQTVQKLQVKRLSNSPLNKSIPAGWSGTISLDRGDPTADNVACAMEQAYWSGLRMPSAQIYEYINEPDGSTSTFLFEGVAFELTDAGAWTQDVAVKQTISWAAGRRRRL